eukprot:226397-Chlamydomonas_euryale.AAC.1
MQAAHHRSLLQGCEARHRKATYTRAVPAVPRAVASAPPAAAAAGWHRRRPPPPREPPAPLATA